MEVPGTGDHCGYATFDFDFFQDEDWVDVLGLGLDSDQKKSQDDVNPKERDDVNQTYDRVGIPQYNTSQRPQAKEGKMKKSFINFKVSLAKESEYSFGI